MTSKIRFATFVVKLIMLMLIGASVWCWAIIVDKIIQYRRARREAARRAAAQLRLDETTAVLTSCARNASTSATARA